MIKYRRDIDALRGIAVLLVVIFHAFPHLLPGGFVGVDVFFVISGFLITSIMFKELDSRHFSFGNFYARRIRRLLPAICSVILFASILGWLVLYPDEYKKLGYHIYRSLFFTQNFNLINEADYFDVSSHYKPLLHLWSLSVEEQFYLIWPVLIYISFYFRKNSIYLMLIIVLLSFSINLYFLNDVKQKIFFHTLTRLWELGIGGLLAAVYFRYPSWNNLKLNSLVTNGVAGLGLFLIGYSAIQFNEALIYPAWYALVPITGSVIFIFASSENKFWFGLQKLGLISYPLYLWHWLILSFLFIYSGNQASTKSLVIAIVVSVALSFLTYRYIERLRYIQNKWITAGLICSLVLLAGVGKFIDKNDGLVERAHLSYLKKYNMEFQRTLPIDKSCKDYVKNLNVDRDFYYCRASFYNKKYPTIVVIGDSHAHAFYAGVEKWAASNSYNAILLANTSCPTLKGFLWGRDRKEQQECQKKIDHILEIIKKDRSIDKVLMLTRGPVYIHDEVKGTFTKSSVADSLKKMIDNKRLNYSTYARGFYNTVKALSDINHIKKIYYFFENPELDFFPKERIERPFDFLSFVKTRFVDRNLYNMRMKDYRLAVQKSALNYPKLVLISVEDFFCHNDVCDSFRNGNFMYADDDHFSVFGAIKLAEAKMKDFLMVRIENS